MIERMIKIRFYAHTEDKKKNLARLQNLGLVDIDISVSKSSLKTQKLTKKLKRYQDLLSKLSHITRNQDKTEIFPESLHTLYQKMIYLEKLLSVLEEKKLALQEMNEEYSNLKVWGNIDWDKVHVLRSNGLQFRFFNTTSKILEKVIPEKSYLFPINQELNQVYILCIDYGELKDDFSFEEIALNETSLEQFEKEIQILKNSIVMDEIKLSGFYSSLDLFKEEIDHIQSLLSFEKAKINLENSSNGLIFAIQGWIPDSKSQKVENYLKEHNISYEILQIDKSDSVPILLKNNLFTKLFEPITKIFSLPKYTEIDPTFFFAPFFMLFFGLSLGDLGYGFLMSVASIAFCLRVKDEWKIYGYLALLLSISTMICGVFFNSVFGEAIFKNDTSSITNTWLNQGKHLAIFSSREVDGKVIYPAMSLSLLLGFIQLSIGLILQSINRIFDKERFLYAIKPLAVLGMIWGGSIIAVYRDYFDLGFNSNFKIGILPIGAFFSGAPETAGIILFSVGMIGFLFFHDPSQSFFLRPIFGIWEFYQMVTGLLGDLLSYIRLFALGLASGLLGNAFNKVALLILPDGNIYSPWIILSIIILVLGHGLNFALGLLGSFVHPLRLTFVEFYKNMNFIGGGKEYRPFAINK